MSQVELFYRFGVALVIGILIGLEREHSSESPGREIIAGVRTFALISLAGCTGALLADTFDSPWPFVALLLFLGILITVAYLNVARSGEIGTTTEVAAIITFLTAALCYWGFIALAAGIAETTTH